MSISNATLVPGQNDDLMLGIVNVLLVKCRLKCQPFKTVTWPYEQLNST